MMNHSGIVSVIKKKVYPLLTKKVHFETSNRCLWSKDFGHQQYSKI